MAIESIIGTQSILGTWADEQKKAVSGQGFSNILSQAIQNTVETDISNANDTVALLSDMDTELHTSMIEAQKAELALNLTIQIRNKVVDAYNEVMRMQV